VRAADVRVLDDVDGDVDGDADGDGSDDVFTSANVWMLHVARSIDARPHAIVVWDGGPGDGSGGTADLVRQLGVQRCDPRVRVIDPTPSHPGAAR
jgi:hypothetical protein